MTHSILSLEVENELLSSVREVCTESDLKLEELVKDYLGFLAGLNASAIEQVSALPNENEKAEWLAKYYFDARINQLQFEALKKEVLIGHDKIKESKVTRLEDVRHEFD
ncbi:hypothetical protein VFJ34_04010 [Streptococcus sp. R4]|uniref:hypothetical protein n=1 Tax=Streptococcus TaxID=1301 RepID=UPI0002BC5FE4|nr:hypothetical protein [Streptococcus agalactiae]MEE3843159.1 hypothetical protein [Streptococcus sp. R4]EPV36905.1 hypothetical protein SAG0346_01060 [Streptococcus agalactiae GB00888]MEB3018644.1 hypothetical protein [Streptococcus agalactiae]MEC3712861.1 hypothetical protein [Streptococcus agalactiae]WPG04228.1 hypothetical protein SDD34_02215 [Streptococcus agalactiae]